MAKASNGKNFFNEMTHVQMPALSLSRHRQILRIFGLRLSSSIRAVSAVPPRASLLCSFQASLFPYFILYRLAWLIASMNDSNTYTQSFIPSLSIRKPLALSLPDTYPRNLQFVLAQTACIFKPVAVCRHHMLD